MGRRHPRRLAPEPQQRPLLPRRLVGPRVGRRLHGTRPPAMAPLLRHLALLVHDLSRARRFYETYFGFDSSSEWHGDTLFIRNDEGFDVALMRGQHPPNPGAFHHIGFLMDSSEQVRKLHTRLEVDAVPILEFVE